MSITLTPSVALDTLVSDISVLQHSYPSPVVYKGKLYVFYTGSGNDGIWYTSYDGTRWAPIVSVRSHVPSVAVSMGTSPSVVVFNDVLYLFYNGAGHDGTYYATFDGSKWNPNIVSVSAHCGGQNFLLETSPSATVFDGTIHLFWNSASGDGIWFTTFDGSWAPQTNLNSLAHGIGIRQRTSPSVCTVASYLYVFYNGGGLDGTFFTRRTREGHWDGITSVSKILPSGMGYLDGTSPAATPLVVGGSWILLVWNGSGDDGLWYTVLTTDGKGAPQVSLKDTIKAEPVLNSSNAGVGMYDNVPFIFWPNGHQRMWFTRGQNLNL